MPGFQFCKQLLIERAAFRLRIGARGTANIGPLVPIEPEPAQVDHQPIAVSQLAALDIGVFDAQNESAAGFPSPQMAEKSGARISQMQGSGRTRGKPGDD